MTETGDATSPLTEVLRIVSDLTGTAVDADTPLLSTGIVDSLSMTDLSDRLSSTFGVPVGVEELGYDNADTPRQLASLVAERK